MATIELNAKKQDLPPPGGYRPINFKRVPARSYFNGWAIFGGYLGMTSVSLYLYYLTCKKVKYEEIEMRSSRHAIFPLLVAERDRAYLKQVRKNRDEEAKLMANVEGWELGKLYGEPLYKTVPKDKLIEQKMVSYYGHTEMKHFADRAFIRQRC